MKLTFTTNILQQVGNNIINTCAGIGVVKEVDSNWNPSVCLPQKQPKLHSLITQYTIMTIA